MVIEEAPKKPRVLFLCVGNSCRSQMAEGLLRNLAEDRFEVHSAGSKPAGLSSRAVKVMAEIGVDISRQSSKPVEQYADDAFDFVVTVCDASASGSCPTFLGRAGKQFHWPFEDPADAVGSETEVLAQFRRVRDQIRTRLERFVDETVDVRGW